MNCTAEALSIYTISLKYTWPRCKCRCLQFRCAGYPGYNFYEWFYWYSRVMSTFKATGSRIYGGFQVVNYPFWLLPALEQNPWTTNKYVTSDLVKEIQDPSVFINGLPTWQTVVMMICFHLFYLYFFPLRIRISFTRMSWRRQQHKKLHLKEQETI